MTFDQIIGITIGFCGVCHLIMAFGMKDPVESKLTRLEGLAFITVSLLSKVMP